MPLKNIEAYTSARHRFVLAVDSSERNLRFLTGLLKQFNYDAYAVRTAAEALEIAGVINPVLIVAGRKLDAGNDAIGLIRSLRSANPECAAPVLVLTTGADPAFERDCLNAGALTCLRAPVTLENFYRVIQVAIEPVPRMTIRIGADLSMTINGSRTDERVRDISENGAYVKTRSLRPLKSKLSVRIRLPDCEVSADAAVIYLRQAGEDRSGESGMGLEFVSISQDDRQRIRLFIRSEMSKGISALPNAR